MAQDGMQDLFTDMIKKAPVLTHAVVREDGKVPPANELTEGVRNLLNSTKTVFDEAPVQHIQAQPVDMQAGLELAEAFRAKRAELGSKDPLLHIEAKRAKIVDRNSGHAALVKIEQAQRRKIIAAMWLLGASWNQLAFALEKKRNTVISLGHKELVELNLAGTNRAQKLSQLQVNAMWNYCVDNPSMFTDPTTFSHVHKELQGVLESYSDE